MPDNRPSPSESLPSPSFCVLPWMHVFADESGTIYPCCQVIDAHLPNVDESNTPYRIRDENALAEGWNSAYMRKMRLGMLAGERPSPCRRCFSTEDSGLRSYRQWANIQWADRIGELVSDTAPDGSAPQRFISFDLRLGNLCNLRCRMCGPHSSKALIQEFSSFYKVKPTHRHFDELRRLDWFSSPEFWSIFEKHSVYMERLHFAGGEPFLIPQMFDFLERLIEKGQSGKIRLSYNTNLTTLPDRLSGLWSRFLSVRVTTSLDGYDAVNSFIRFPANWETINRNLQLLDEQRRFVLKGGLGVNVTVQVYNIFRLHELIRYLALEFQTVEPPNLSLLRAPEHFSIQVLPREMKEQAAAQLRRFVEEFEHQWPARWRGEQLDRLKTSIEGVIRFMMGADQSHLLNMFRRWTKHLDGQRNHRMEDVLPELSPLCAAPAADTTGH